MPEQDIDTTPADEAEKAPETAQQQKPDAQDDEDRRGGQKALQADLAKERKTRQALEKKLQEIEDAKLSELDRAKKEADQLRKDLENARIESLRSRIAVKHGIPAEDAELFLTASDEERLTKQAERLAARIKADAAGPSKKTPAPDKSQGARSSSDHGIGTDGLAEARRRYGTPA